MFAETSFPLWIWIAGWNWRRLRFTLETRSIIRRCVRAPWTGSIPYQCLLMSSGWRSCRSWRMCEGCCCWLGSRLNCSTFPWIICFFNGSCSSMCLFSLSVRGRYCLQRFAAVIMRIREPKTTALIFASGKMVILGFRYDSHLFRMLCVVEFHTFSCSRSCRDDALIWHAFSCVVDLSCAYAIAISSGVHRCKEWATVEAGCQKGVNMFAGFWNDRLLGLWIAPLYRLFYKPEWGTRWKQLLSNVFLTIIGAVCSHHSKAWFSSPIQGELLILVMTLGRIQVGALDFVLAYFRLQFLEWSLSFGGISDEN